MAEPALVLAGISKIGSLLSGRKARKRRRRARQAQLDIGRIRNFQSRRVALQQFRQAQAQALLGGVASGAELESSGVQGSVASLGSQARLNITEAREQQRLATFAGQQLDKADKADFTASVFGSIGSFALQPGVRDIVNKTFDKITGS